MTIRISLFCYFVATFGAMWLICVRASDRHTERWNSYARWLKLLVGTVVWVAVFVGLGEYVFAGDPKRSAAVIVAKLAGFPCGIAAYAVVAWLWPGTAGARRMTTSRPPVIPQPPLKSTDDWLLLDLRAIPALWRRRKRGR